MTPLVADGALAFSANAAGGNQARQGFLVLSHSTCRSLRENSEYGGALGLPNIYYLERGNAVRGDGTRLDGPCTDARWIGEKTDSSLQTDMSWRYV